jgi:hypothetical protein
VVHFSTFFKVINIDLRIDDYSDKPAMPISMIDLYEGWHEIIRAQRRAADHIDLLPDPPKLAQGFTAVFTADEVYANFDRYVKLFQDTFGK